MSLPEFAQLDEENGRLRDQLVDLETEKDAEIAELKAEINELKAQSQGCDCPRPVLKSQDGWVWKWNAPVGIWERSHEERG